MKKIIVNEILKYILNENKDFSDKIIAYHGTNSKFKTFNDSSPIFFVDNIEVAKTYGENIIKVELELNNPIEVDFRGGSTYYFLDKWYYPSDLANKFKEISEDIKLRYVLDDEITNELEDLNFNSLYGDLDGVIMKDINDSYDILSIKKTTATNYVVFNKNQIKII